jgi:hypothetical protein
MVTRIGEAELWRVDTGHRSEVDQWGELEQEGMAGGELVLVAGGGGWGVCSTPCA